MKNTLLYLLAKTRPVVLATLCFFVISPVAATADNMAYLAVYTDGDFGVIDMDTGAFAVLGNSGLTLAGLGVMNGKLYATSLFNSNGNLYTVNPANGSITLVGSSGISYDEFGSTTQGLFAIGSNANLYSINPATGAATLVGPIGVGFGSWRNISCNAAALYFANGTDLYTINTNTGAVSLIGDMGGPLLGAILLENGILYGGQETPGVHVDILDTNTGVATVGPALTGASGVFGGLAPYPLAAVFEPICTNLTVTISAGSTNCTVTTNAVTIGNGLVSWYKADGDATDSFGTNNGSLEGGTAFDASQSGQAFLFHASSSPTVSGDDVNVGNLTALDNATGVTLSAYIKVSNNYSNVFIFSQGDSVGSPPESQATCWYFLSSTHSLSVSLPFVTSSNTFNDAISASVVLATGQWVHVAFTWRNSDGLTIIYTNSVQAATANFATGLTIPPFANSHDATNLPPGQGARVGTAAIGAGRFCVSGFTDPITVYNSADGDVDNLRIYSRALSSDEIQQIMLADAGATVTNCDTSDAVTTNLDLCTVPSGQLQILNAAPGNVQLSWPAQSNAWYLLQGSDELSPLNWMTVWSGQAGDNTNIIVPDSTSSRPHRFYRLLSTE